MCVHGESCLTLCKSMGCSLPGPPVYEIFQARILEWIAISFFKESSRPRDWTHISFVYCIGRQIHLSHLVTTSKTLIYPQFSLVAFIPHECVCVYSSGTRQTPLALALALALSVSLCVYIYTHTHTERERERERETGKQTGRQTGRQTDRQTARDRGVFLSHWKTNFMKVEFALFWNGLYTQYTKLFMTLTSCIILIQWENEWMH